MGCASIALMGGLASSSASTPADVVVYYEAFEALLREARAIGEYRTHFGFLEAPSDDYCFFKAVAKPRTHTAIREQAQLAMDRLHTELFGAFPVRRGRVLDVGFGCGGTLERLSREWPEAELHGINLNPVQFAIAEDALSRKENVHLSLADFLEHPFTEKFDLVYFIESAFHIADKDRLCARLAELLAEGGRAFIVDIFNSARLERRNPSAPTAEDIFDYRSVQTWTKLLERHGLALTAFEDWTGPVALHTRVNTPEDEFLRDMVAPSLPQGEQSAALERQLMHAYHGYKRLSRLFARELLHYGILRCEKPQSGLP